MSDKGFSQYKTETLLAVRAGLLRGLERLAKTIEAGSFHTVGPKGASPPSEGGHVTLMLLESLQTELDKRGHPLDWGKARE